MGTREELDALKADVEQCKNNMQGRLAAVEEQLRHQGKDRKRYNEEMRREIETLKGWFSNHSTEEMAKYDELISLIKKLVDDTDGNTEFIESVKKYWIRITMLGSGVVITLGAIYWLYTFLQKHGLVIVFEKAAG